MTQVLRTLPQAIETPTSETGVTPARFREAMSRVGAAVHVVTTAGPAGRGGATMTAVTSVSDTPPTVLICLNSNGRLSSILRDNGVFAINTLVEGDEPLAGVFAGVGGLDHEARFGVGTWGCEATGAPILAGARMALDCRVSDVSEIGSHIVVFGKVEAVYLGETNPALLYIDRDYRVLPRLTAAD